MACSGMHLAGSSCPAFVVCMLRAEEAPVDTPLRTGQKNKQGEDSKRPHKKKQNKKGCGDAWWVGEVMCGGRGLLVEIMGKKASVDVLVLRVQPGRVVCGMTRRRRGGTDAEEDNDTI